MYDWLKKTAKTGGFGEQGQGDGVPEMIVSWLTIAVLAGALMFSLMGCSPKSKEKIDKVTKNPVVVFTYTQRDVEWDIDPKLRKILKTMDYNDILELTVTSFGGSVYTMMELSDMLESVPGIVHVHVKGYSMSAGTIIMFAGDTLTIHSNSTIMMHMASSGGVKMPLTDSIQQIMVQLMSKTYGKYLTDREHYYILAGGDYFMLGAELDKRIKSGKTYSTSTMADKMYSILNKMSKEKTKPKPTKKKGRR